ncbi:hypothetical protein [Abyssalbus ytuae]|uniref:Phenylalanyl-tRNA synthetase subunit alpha n=1 Tax=Abyssalbus ytuae TaxID=2926907 RepID=A0A9E6ZYD4_9FLAO|nr:hypothetical protein [Abyssalbus ytuae]UOB19231.1 hypothetical protein MQE35_08010 [Abyssalbus ytuae]
MKKDIEIPVSTGVYIAIAHEWNEDFLAREWNSYLINDNEFDIEMVLIVTKGYTDEVKTSTMRHGIGKVKARSFTKIEMIQEEVLKLNNEFYVTYFHNNKLFEKKFFIEKDSFFSKSLQSVPFLEEEGIILT